MDKKLKSLFYNHLVKMVNKGTKINSGLRPFYVQHGSKDEVWKNLRVKESHNFQKKLDQLFPEEFTVVAGFLLFSEHSSHNKNIKEQAILRRKRLEAHILACQKAAHDHKGGKGTRDYNKLRPLGKKSRGKQCPTCDVEMRSSKGLFGLTIEHIVPVSHGGNNSYDGEFPQCVGMCWLCNQTRNKIVLGIGQEKKHGKVKITDRAIRFLITQVHGRGEELDEQMSSLFWKHHQLASSQNVPVDDYDLFGEGEYVEYKISPNETSTLQTPSSSDDSSNEDTKPVYIELSKEKAIVQLREDLINEIEDSIKVDKLYRIERLERLFLKHGSFGLFKQKIGMKDCTIEALLFQLYPNQFIVETKGTVQFIYTLDSENNHFYNFAADVEIPDLNEKKYEPLENFESKPIKPEPVSLPVLFARESISALLDSNSHTRISLESITEALDDLRKEDGESWDAYFAKFDVKGSGTQVERIHMLLTECGFSCRLEKEQQRHFIQFELPHHSE